MPVVSESLVVEDYIVKRLIEKGWRFVRASDLNREDLKEPLIILDLFEAVKRINRGLELTEGDINRVISDLKFSPATMEGVKRVLTRLKHGVPIKLEKEGIVKSIHLIDYENLERNEFIVSRQVEYVGKEEIRADIVLYVNGIPLVLIECKSPAKPYSTLEDAYRQVKRYEISVPELFKYVQFSISAEWNARYFPNTTDGTETAQEIWRVEGIEDEVDAVIEMLEKETLLDLLRHFIFVREVKGKQTRVIARWMQYEATNKMIDRIVKNVRGEDKRKNGLIWHWLGSGKTLTMLFTANKLWTLNILENPTIFFVVDRVELEEQLRNEYEAMETSLPELKRIESVKELIETLRIGKRGTFLTLIHKFRPEEIKELVEELEKLSNEETIITRKNVVVFIDEAHRTQYGLLAAAMRCVLRNAFFFAFTGTPIAKGGKDTYAIFAYPEYGEYYLHEYFIDKSQRDGHTIPRAFETRLRDIVGLKYNKEIAEDYEYFLEAESFEELEDRLENYKEMIDFLVERGVLKEVPDEYKTQVRDKIRRRLDKIKVFMEKPERIEIIAEDIAKHFKEEVDGKFKAMVVTPSRVACVRYKRALDRAFKKFGVQRAEQYTEVVMTYSQKDPEEISSYKQRLKERYGRGKDIDEINKEIVNKFKEEEYPKIVIVTDMLITGFDHPQLQTIYLDKPLKGHLLLQTVARVNRPYVEKEIGLVVDYVGVLEDYEKALAFYEKEDYERLSKSFKETKGILKEFEVLLRETEGIIQLNRYLEKKAKTIRFDRETLRNLTDPLLLDEEKAEEFVRNYKKLRRIFEFLGSHPEKLQYRTEFLALTEVYYTYLHRRRDFEETEEYFKKYFPKTLQIIQESIDLGEIEKIFPIITLNEDYLKKLAESYQNIEERVYNMVFDLRKFVYVEKSRITYFETIGERVNKILRELMEKKIQVQEAYERLKEIVDEVNEIRRRSKELTRRELAVLLPLERALGKSPQLVTAVKDTLSEIEKEGLFFEGWNLKKEVIKKVGLKIRTLLIKQKLPYDQREQIYEEIMDSLCKVG